MVFDRTKNPSPPPQGALSIDDLQRHAVDINFYLENLVVKGDNNITDATNSSDIVTQFNALLSELRDLKILKE